MIWLAGEDDIPRIVTMGRRFFEKSGYAGEYSEDAMTTAARELIADENGILIVSPEGMIGGMVYPLYMTGQRVAQEFFWWSEDGSGQALLSAFECRARWLGATAVTMVALDTLRPSAVGALYRRRGYRPLEYSYVKEFNDGD